MEYETHEEAKQALRKAIEDFVKNHGQIREISEAVLNLTYWESTIPLKMRKIQMWLGMSMMALKDILNDLK